MIIGQSRAYLTFRVIGRVEFGPMQPGERNFVKATWTEGLTDAAGHGRMSGSRHRDVYQERNWRLVEDLLLLPDTQVVVARDAEDKALAYGWCAWAGDTVYWVSVKRAFRRLGLGHALLPEGARHYTWPTRFDEVAKRRGLSLRPLEVRRRSA